MSSNFYAMYEGELTDLDNIFYKPEGGSGAGALGLIGPNGDLGTLYSDAVPLDTKLNIYGNTGDDIGFIRGKMGPPSLVISSPWTDVSLSHESYYDDDDTGGEGTNWEYYTVMECSGDFTCSLSLGFPCDVDLHCVLLNDWCGGNLVEKSGLFGWTNNKRYFSDCLSDTVIGTLSNVTTALLEFTITGSGRKTGHGGYSGFVSFWFVATNACGTVTSPRFSP